MYKKLLLEKITAILAKEFPKKNKPLQRLLYQLCVKNSRYGSIALENPSKQSFRMRPNTSQKRQSNDFDQICAEKQK